MGQRVWRTTSQAGRGRGRGDRCLHSEKQETQSKFREDSLRSGAANGLKQQRDWFGSP